MEKRYKLTYTAIAAALMLSSAGLEAYGDEQTPLDSLGNEVELVFRNASPEDILGGVSKVNVVELQKKSYTTYSLSNMQSLVAGYNGQLWNMGEALVLVDGVPRDADNIISTEIESVSFLKGAQAVVLYGSRAANGVILITTKRGRTTGLQVSVRGDATLFTPKAYPKYLGAAEYMTLYNEARVNDGLDKAFTDVDIYNYASGNNPWRYPDINFFSTDYLRRHSWRYEGQAEFTGGGRYATFYALVGLYHSDDIINFGEGKNNGDTRLNVRGNIDLRLNDWVTGWVNTSASFYDNRSDLADYWAQSATMRPTVPGAAPLVPLIPVDAIESGDLNSWILVDNSRYLVDGKYLLGGTQQYPTNPFAAMYAAGHSKYTSRQLQFDAGFRINLEKVVPGLRFVGRGAVDYNTSYVTSINNTYATYQATWSHYSGKDMICELQKFGNDLSTGIQNMSNSNERQTMMFSGQFDYKNRFNGIHGVEANVIAHGYKRTVTGEYHRTTNASLAMRAAYNYDSRYYVEFNGALNHSAKFAPGKRNGFSPVASIGWRISQEDFLRNSPVVDELKINATYGRIMQDIDITGYYMYDTKFTADGDWWGWNDGHKGIQTFQSRQGANPDLTFVKRKEFNAGVETSLWNGSLKASAELFIIDTEGLPVEARNLFPSYMATIWPNSSFVPWINYNSQRRKGFTLALAGTRQFGDVTLSLGANVMYTTARNTRISENVEYDWQRAEGAHTDAIRGYRCLGFFKDEADVASSAKINNETRPGDLKYQDMNNDHIIDSRDQVEIGRWTAPWSYGFNLTARYKGFTLFVAGSGNAGGTAVMDNQYAWVYGDRKYSDIVRGRWTPKTAGTATYPRLTTQSGDLNFVTSDFWTYSSDAFYLNQVQLTYNFPARWFNDKFVKGIDLYVNGNDLLTLCSNRRYRETNVGAAPQMRSYNLGVKINF